MAVETIARCDGCDIVIDRSRVNGGFVNTQNSGTLSLSKGGDDIIHANAIFCPACTERFVSLLQREYPTIPIERERVRRGRVYRGGGAIGTTGTQSYIAHGGLNDLVALRATIDDYHEIPAHDELAHDASGDPDAN